MRHHLYGTCQTNTTKGCSQPPGQLLQHQQKNQQPIRIGSAQRKGVLQSTWKNNSRPRTCYYRAASLRNDTILGTVWRSFDIVSLYFYWDQKKITSVLRLPEDPWHAVASYFLLSMWSVCTVLPPLKTKSLALKFLDVSPAHEQLRLVETLGLVRGCQTKNQLEG